MLPYETNALVRRCFARRLLLDAAAAAAAAAEGRRQGGDPKEIKLKSREITPFGDPEEISNLLLRISVITP